MDSQGLKEDTMSQIIVMAPQEVEDLIRRSVDCALLAFQAAPRGKALLTGPEVEKEYGIKARNLEGWRARGTGPRYTTIGRRVYYEREAIEALIKSGNVNTSGRGD